MPIFKEEIVALSDGISDLETILDDLDEYSDDDDAYDARKKIESAIEYLEEAKSILA